MKAAAIRLAVATTRRRLRFAESKIDGTHAAALIDVDLGGEGAGLSILGGADITGGSGITGGPGNLNASCLLDGLLCDGILS